VKSGTGKEPFRMSTGNPIPVLKGSFERGENDKQYILQGEILEGELISLFPVDDVIIKDNYVQFADFL
jgi:hypothetical protein